MVDGTAAVGWILHHGYLGALSDRLNLRGLRARIGNIQVGSEAIFEHLFKERRFNSWTVGEVHILSDCHLVPNARRDDFEFNNHYSNFQNQLARLPKNSCVPAERNPQRDNGRETPPALQRSTTNYSLKKKRFVIRLQRHR